MNRRKGIQKIYYVGGIGNVFNDPVRLRSLSVLFIGKIEGREDEGNFRGKGNYF